MISTILRHKCDKPILVMMLRRIRPNVLADATGPVAY